MAEMASENKVGSLVGAREVHSARQYASLRNRQRETYQRVIDTLNDARSMPLAKAARQNATTVPTVRRYGGSALTRDRYGKLIPRRANRLYAEVGIVTPEGRRFVGVAGSRARSLAAQHANAVKHYLRTGDATRLGRFRGKRVGGVELVTDLALIERLGNRGLVGDDQFYRLR